MYQFLLITAVASTDIPVSKSDIPDGKADISVDKSDNSVGKPDIPVGKSDVPSWTWAWVEGGGNGLPTYPKSNDAFNIISCYASYREGVPVDTRGHVVGHPARHTVYEWFFKSNKSSVDSQRIVINKKGNTAVLNGGSQWDGHPTDRTPKGWAHHLPASYEHCNQAFGHHGPNPSPSFGISTTGTMNAAEFHILMNRIPGKALGNSKIVPLRLTGPKQKEPKVVDVALAFGRGLGNGVCGQCHLIYYEDNGVGKYVAMYQVDARSPSFEMTGDAASYLIPDNIGDSKGARVPLYQHVDCRRLTDAIITKTELQTGSDVGYHPDDSEAQPKCEGYKHNSSDVKIEYDQPVNQPSNPNHMKQYWEETHFKFGASQFLHV